MWLDVCGHPVAIAVQLDLLGAGPVARAECFEGGHCFGDPVGTGDVRLKALDEAAQRVGGDGEGGEVLKGD